MDKQTKDAWIERFNLEILDKFDRFHEYDAAFFDVALGWAVGRGLNAVEANDLALCITLQATGYLNRKGYI